MLGIRKDAPNRPSGGPKSVVCRQAQKGSRNGRFASISEHFRAGGAHGHFWRSKITSLQVGPERASERPIGVDFGAFQGQMSIRPREAPWSGARFFARCDWARRCAYFLSLEGTMLGKYQEYARNIVGI